MSKITYVEINYSCADESYPHQTFNLWIFRGKNNPKSYSTCLRWNLERNLRRIVRAETLFNITRERILSLGNFG